MLSPRMCNPIAVALWLRIALHISTLKSLTRKLVRTVCDRASSATI